MLYCCRFSAKGFNDDAMEKRARRKSMAIEFSNRDLISSPAPKNKNAAKTRFTDDDVVDGGPVCSSAQLSDLYSNCIKMCTENKINQKNSWSLNLIDYIGEVLDTRHGEMTNFQVASCTLDASVKIFSCRVDSVLSDAFKVCSRSSRLVRCSYFNLK